VTFVSLRTVNSVIPLDSTDWAILRELQADARTPVRALGEAVGLSPSAAAERKRRLEEAGVIGGYRAVVDPAAVGLTVQAVARVNIPGARYDRINALLPELPEVYQCFRVAGDECYVLLIRCHSVEHLDRVAQTLATTGHVTMNVVYETVVEARPVEAIPPA
jgi:Lrp/AsnC family leucine-responsive transcriptional regulator